MNIILFVFARASLLGSLLYVMLSEDRSVYTKFTSSELIVNFDAEMWKVRVEDEISWNLVG